MKGVQLRKLDIFYATLRNARSDLIHTVTNEVAGIGWFTPETVQE